MEESVQPEKRRWRPQFSLFTLLLIVVLAGAAIGIYVARRQIERSRLEVIDLREQAGYLNIGDPTTIWARSVKMNDKNQWRWKVYVPKSGRYRICCQFEKISATGFDPSVAKVTTCELPAGEFTIDALASPAEAGTGELRLEAPSVSTSFSFQFQMLRHGIIPPFDDWIRDNRTISQISEYSTAYAFGEPLFLIRVRGALMQGRPVNGLLIWLEEDPAK